MEPGKRGATVTRIRTFGAVWPRPIREVAFQKSSRCAKQTRKVAACIRRCNETRGAVNKLVAEFIFKGRDCLLTAWLTQSSFLCDRGGKLPFQLRQDRTSALHQHLSTPNARILYGNGFLRGIAILPPNCQMFCQAYKNKQSEKEASFPAVMHIQLGNGWYSREVP